MFSKNDLSKFIEMSIRDLIGLKWNDIHQYQLSAGYIAKSGISNAVHFVLGYMYGKELDVSKLKDYINKYSNNFGKSFFNLNYSEVETMVNDFKDICDELKRN